MQKHKTTILPILLFAIIGVFLYFGDSTSQASQVVKNAPVEVSLADITGNDSYIVTLNPISIGGDLKQNLSKTEISSASKELLMNRNPGVFSEKDVAKYTHLPIMSVELTKDELETIKADPLVESIQKNMIRFHQLDQSTPHIGADSVQAGGIDGSGTAVAILDTGVDRHQFVNIVSDACFSNSGGGGGGTSLCPNETPSSTSDGSGDDCPESISGCDHGTHVAGIAAGGTNRQRINFQTSVSTIGENENVTINLYLASGSGSITDYDFEVTYDDTLLTYVSFGEATVDGLTTNSPISPADGTIDISGSMASPSPLGINGMNIHIGSIIFNAGSFNGSEVEISATNTGLNKADFTMANGSNEKPSIGEIELSITAATTPGTINTLSTSSMFGVAPGAGIISIQVFTQYDGTICMLFFGSNPCIGASDSNIIAGLNRVQELQDDPAFNYNIAAVNMSLGGGLYSTQSSCDAAGASYIPIIETLRSNGIATIVSSGNSGSGSGVSAPGCVSPAIAVGSTTLADEISSFSNGNEMLDLLAPGSGIRSSVPGGGYGNKSGTSMAAPHVTGAWALLKQTDPAGTVNDLLSTFQGSGSFVTDPRNNLSFSRTDALAALIDLSKSVNVSALGSTTSEDGAAVTVEFSLASEPSDNVTIPLSTDDTSEGSLGGITEIIISPANWNQPANNQVVVTGVDDSLRDGNQSYSLVTGDPSSPDPFYDAGDSSSVDDVNITNIDNDLGQVFSQYKRGSGGLNLWRFDGSAGGSKTPELDITLSGFHPSSIKQGGYGDFDGDGDQDLLLFYRHGASKKTKVWMLENNNGKIDSAKLLYYLPAWTWNSIKTTSAGDTNGDGLDDVTVIYKRGSGGVNIWTFYGNETLTLTQPILNTVLTQWSQSSMLPVGMADLNNDGYEDLTVFYKRASSGFTNHWIYYGSPGGLGQPTFIQFLNNWRWDSTRAAGSLDANADGYGESVVIYRRGDGDDNIWSFSGSPSGISKDFIGRYVNAEWDKSKQGHVSDINGDGYEDIVQYHRTSQNKTTVKVLNGSTGGLTMPQTDLSLNWAWSSIFD